MFLPDDAFRQVVAATPLVSIDLVVEDEAGRVLLGLRTNRPARGCWFVPGGRIRKNERIEDALRRLGETELGRPLAPADVRLLGVYEHFYEDSVFGDGPDTHYVVLAYGVRWPADQEVRTDAQHERYAWWSRDKALASPEVHAFTKAYLAADLEPWARYSSRLSVEGE